ncbi:uncharacterized protein LOC123534554 [Mercenaria mercenaria]|uniref:uncharacterized protein LOC123534554 n=1 Tax=Mercenaria mercenaria TaxID=6596 RepID=UPI001E1DD79F|nr:uncharacterized protein LOC123534554 [Mercenaria mercenaria]
MAEGVNLTSVKDGTDVDFGFVCTPCGEDHIRKGAVKYCPLCLEYLCATCTKHHGRQNATRSHKLLDRDDANTISVIAVTTKCHIHPEQDIEFFCNSHDMVCCAKCIATEHRSSCFGVVSINEVIPSLVEDKMIQQKQDEMKDIQKCLTSIPIRNQEFIDSMQIQKGKIFNKIEEVEKNLIEHIAKLKKELTASLDQIHANINEEYVSEVNNVTPMIKDLEEMTAHLQVVQDKDNVDTAQTFVLLKLAGQMAKDAAKMYDDWECSGTKTLYFMENQFKTSMTTANLGQICQIIVPRNSTHLRKLVKNMNIKTKRGRSIYSINDICMLQDGTIIVADHANKVHWLDTKYRVKDVCNLGASPSSICCTGQNEVAVKMNNNTVQFISAAHYLNKLESISVSDGTVKGLVHCHGELWVSTRQGIDVYNKSGSKLRCIEKDTNAEDKGIFAPQCRGMAVSEDTVIVTWFNEIDGAVCFRGDGLMLRELRHRKLKGTIDVCASNDGTVFLLGSASRNIVLFSVDGKYVREYSTADNCLGYAQFIRYDDKKKCIIVINLDNSISIIDISDDTIEV